MYLLHPTVESFFFKTLLDIIISEMGGILICGRDVSIVMNSKFDTTTRIKVSIMSLK